MDEDILWEDESKPESDEGSEDVSEQFNDMIDSIFTELDKERKEKEKELMAIQDAKYDFTEDRSGTFESKLNNSIGRSIHSRKNRDLIDGLTQAQLKSIELTIKGYSAARIAREIDVSPQTIYKWKKNDNYNALLERTRKDYLKAYQNTIMSHIPDAVGTLVEAMNDVDADWRDRITASRALLEFSNIKKGGIRDEDADDKSSGKPQLIIFNANPPQKEKPEKERAYEDIIDNDDMGMIENKEGK